MGDKERKPRPVKCSVCKGEGGTMVEPNGKAHERGVKEWQACSVCGGTGYIDG